MNSGINQKQDQDIKQEAAKAAMQALDRRGSGSGTAQAKSGSTAAVKKKRDRDANVELLRLLACIMVIAGHARPFMVAQDGSIMDAALMIQAFAAPAVGIFFLISLGYFLRSVFGTVVDYENLHIFPAYEDGVDRLFHIGFRIIARYGK